MTMLNAFVDELEKLADAKTYPISRFLTSPAAAGSTGLLLGRIAAASSGVGSPAVFLPGALTGASRMAGTALGRLIGARGMTGRLARGGRGLMGHEKTLLAQMSGMSHGELESVLESIAKKSEGKSTNPISRLLSTKYNPFNIPDRLIGIRGIAGRVAKGGEHLTDAERGVLDQLRKEKWLRRGKIGGLAGGGAAVAGVGLKQLLGQGSD